MTKNSVKLLYLSTNKINRYNEESNGNEHLTLAYTDESKDTLKSMKNYVITQAITIKNI